MFNLFIIGEGFKEGHKFQIQPWILSTVIYLMYKNFSSEMRKQLKMSFSIEYFIVIYKKETMAEVILKDS